MQTVTEEKPGPPRTSKMEAFKFGPTWKIYCLGDTCVIKVTPVTTQQWHFSRKKIPQILCTNFSQRNDIHYQLLK